ncbi:polysaccharide biosynthesis/export family protein [Endozoicomonas arenosclerae]|uniref:polysaccharide biosynthesis/export family protein n=1 Tax=Endozoicomonas arenosclerae TaxID=1633495 RepID=UPI0007852BB3|nr:polysaccharide biosynthesis/export family protein [Endozoicomonas arenosclerae]
MKKIITIIQLFLLTSLFSSVALSNLNSLESSSYQLSVGDRISVTVYGEAEMGLKETRLSDAGTISMPFIGEIKVSGMSVGRLQRYIEGKLRGDYLVEPSVTVRILEYRKFFVRGQVKKPGAFAFEPGLTLGKAVALAGGFTERASKKTVKVVREDVQGEQSTLTFKLNERLQPGDIINVQESFF